MAEKGASAQSSGTGAFVLAAALVVGGVSLAGTSPPARGGTSGGDAEARAAVQARSTRTVEAMRRLERKGYRVTARVTADGSNCEAHSYGEVRSFFRDQPCAALGRALFEVRDRRRNVVLVAVAVVGMSDPDSASAYKRLVDRDGTGNVTELSRERGRYRSVRFTGDIYTSGRDDAVVINAQAQPVGRGPGAAVLGALARAALSRPPSSVD